jgi:hypothetical protein
MSCQSARLSISCSLTAVSAAPEGGLELCISLLAPGGVLVGTKVSPVRIRPPRLKAG